VTFFANHSDKAGPYNCGINPNTLSGYHKFEGPDPAEWTHRGYAVINIDARGSFDSEGNMMRWGPLVSCPLAIPFALFAQTYYSKMLSSFNDRSLSISMIQLSGSLSSLGAMEVLQCKAIHGSACPKSITLLATHIPLLSA